MQQLSLTFANGESSLSVRKFRVREAISEPFVIDIEARAASADVDFEGLIGEAAIFALNNAAQVHGSSGAPQGGTRKWTGVCIRAEQVRVEADGLSTYEIRIVPVLWVMQKRKNYRAYQHISAVDIAAQMLSEWKIDHEIEIQGRSHTKLELRVQYGESDFNFFCRMMEEAGISHYFRQDADRGNVLVLCDEPHAANARPVPLTFADDPGTLQSAMTEYATAVRLKREMRPGRVVLRDFDFRKPRYELFADAAVSGGLEEQLEQFHYLPGSFVTEGHDKSDTPSADDLGVARACQVAGSSFAQRILQGERARRRQLQFDTNAFDVSPGTVLNIHGHPRAELAPSENLLIVGLEMSGEVNEEWTASARALFTDTPFQPARCSEKPKINGVQSAVVVGPEDETVYTDEFGRIRVQFHWDRDGNYDTQSSCWMRVSQAWAGPGYGLFNLPRVGHEVLVGFVEGDPDQPIVVGRVFNGALQVPYPLPGSKMMSGWKSDSNSNIMLFDDTPGDEMFYTQAERNKLGIVKRHEAYITGGRKTEYVGTTEKTLVRTSAMRVACAHHKQLAGITNSFTSAINFKVETGFGATIKAGNKFQANVTPVVPFIRALMDVKDAKIQIVSKLPGGKAPDLKQMLPARNGGPQPQPQIAQAAPNMTQQETEDALKKTLGVVAKAVSQFEPEEVEAMADAEDLDAAVDRMLQTLQKKGGEKAVQAMTSAQALTAQLKQLSLANAQQSQMNQNSPMQAQQQGQQGQKVSGMFDKLLLAIVEMILPKTKITIKHQKITLETEKAKVELHKDDIKLEAKGDITIKADGKVKIEGASVDICPSPCKGC